MTPTADARAVRGGEEAPPAPTDLRGQRPVLTFLRGGIPALVVLVLFLAVWGFVSWYLPDPHDLFPGPLEVWSSLVHLVESDQLLPHLKVTMARLLKGFFLSLLVGGVIALAMARLPAVERGLKPYLLGLQSLPSIAWAPLCVIWFGISEASYVFITVIGSVFAVAISFHDALASVRPAHVLAARNMGSKGLGLLVRVKIPAALPPIVSGIKQCWSFAWRSLLGAEIVFITVGLGFLLNSGRELLDTPLVIAVMVITLVLGIVFEILIFTRVERWVRKRWGLT